jgi:cytochrome c553
MADNVTRKILQAAQDRLQCSLIATATIIAGLLTTTAPASAQPIAERLAPCLACHGETGTSQTPGVPSLGGQPAPFILIQLYQFREKQRIAEPMNRLTAEFTDDDLRLFSDEIAKLPPPAPPDGVTPDAALIEKGRAAAQHHRCGFCHNPDMSGHDQIPRIGAQREDYLARVLREYKSGERRGYDPAMVEVAVELKEDEIAALAHYLAFLR